ncbi:HOOK multi-domain protein [Pyrenophora tritici-repentis]|nr:HOOK multi-domain protein [Pyrenophora tritici-repentis]
MGSGRGGANKEVVRNFGGGSSLQGEQTPTPMEDDNWDRAVALESDNKDLSRKNVALKNENANLEKELRETKHQLQQSDDQLSQLRAKLEVLEVQHRRTVEDLSDEKAAHVDANTTIDRLFAENERAQAARQSAIKERDDALSQSLTLHQQLGDITAQWQDLDEKNNQLMEELEATQEIADSAAELEHDLKKLREEHIDQDREILVKNERIENLEQQIQKANKRLLEMADEKARAAAASPTDDNRHIGSLGDSLEDELSGLDNESYYEPEFNEYSAITEISTQPIEPARAPPSSIHTQEASSVAPVAAPAPTLTVYVGDAANTQPIQPTRAPASTVHVQEVANYAPVEPARAPASAITEYESISVAPVAARIPTQSVHYNDAASTTPIEPTRAPSTIFEQEVASFAPVEPDRVPSAVTEYEVASFAPVEPTRALSTVTEHEIANFAPIEPTRILSTITEQEVFSFAPIESPRVLSTIAEYAGASTEPVEPARAHSTFTQQEVVSVAPVQPSLPTLSLSIAEAANTSPRVRQITTTDLSTQTVEPQQTPVSTRGTQTRSITPSVPNNYIDSVMITHEIEPVAQSVITSSPTASTSVQTEQTDTQSVVTSSPTTSIGVQTTGESDTEETVIIENPVVTSPTTVKLGKKRSSLVWFFGVLDVILSIYCFYIFSELAYWKNANGYGFGDGYGNVASRSGAFGNGRHLFGIPLGMTVGNSWISESVARHMSAAISRIEDWAGIAYEPHY